MNRWKEVAKFACGWEAFHAVAAYFGSSGITPTFLGITIAPAVSTRGCRPARRDRPPPRALRLETQGRCHGHAIEWGVEVCRNSWP